MCVYVCVHNADVKKNNSGHERWIKKPLSPLGFHKGRFISLHQIGILLTIFRIIVITVAQVMTTVRERAHGINLSEGEGVSQDIKRKICGLFGQTSVHRDSRWSCNIMRNKLKKYEYSRGVGRNKHFYLRSSIFLWLQSFLNRINLNGDRAGGKANWTLSPPSYPEKVFL